MSALGEVLIGFLRFTIAAMALITAAVAVVFIVYVVVTVMRMGEKK